MKVVRLKNNRVIEVIPAEIPLSRMGEYYNDDFAASCMEAPDEVGQHWTYIGGVWSLPSPPPVTVLKPSIENYLLDLDYRLSLIELGVN